MTIQAALEKIDFEIEYKQKIIAGMNELLAEWASKPMDVTQSLANVLKREAQGDIKSLQYIRQQIQPKSCRHPKKYQDKDPNGKLYCTLCNQNMN